MQRAFKITVMLGGPSAEREVSLRSGRSVASALRSLGHHITELDPHPSGWRLPQGTEVVFLALHGTYGEDGSVQTELDRLGVPYTGCDASASRLAFNKLATKTKFLELGLPTARFLILDSADATWPPDWSIPVVLKPVCQGSSVGLHFVDRIADFSSALKDSLAYGSKVIMEERILGRETTVGVLGREVLPLVEVCPRAGRYDYQSKYTPGATDYFCPAKFDASTTRQIQEIGMRAFQAIGGRDYGRVDIIVRSNGEPVVLEVNTLPGMTETSLFPKAAKAVGLDYAALCQKMIELALHRNESRLAPQL